MKRTVTILSDRIEDDVYESAKARGEDTAELVPIHVMLGEALAARGHTVKRIAATRDVERLFKALLADESDVVFNVCDGLEGDMKCAPNLVALLELLGKPFTGSGSTAMRLAGDKTVAKQIFLANGIATPRYTVVPRGVRRWAGRSLDFPLFVKPTDEDASIGITERSIVRDVDELLERVAVVHQEFGSAALVEEFIPGREIYVSVIGNERPVVLPLLEWPMKSVESIGSYDAKWKEDHESYQRRADVFPTDLPDALVERIRREALVAYRALRLADYARFDIRLANDGTPHFLEANPNPFFDRTAEVAMAASSVGLDYSSLAERIVEYALERWPSATAPAPRRTTRSRQKQRRHSPKPETVKNGSGRKKKAA